LTTNKPGHSLAISLNPIKNKNNKKIEQDPRNKENINGANNKQFSQSSDYNNREQIKLKIQK